MEIFHLETLLIRIAKMIKNSGEIFFHYSQVSADVPDLRVGNDVEFLIENRKDKQVQSSYGICTGPSRTVLLPLNDLSTI